MSFRTIEVSDPTLAPPGVQFVTVKSPALKRRADLTVYVPPGARDERLPLVTLLHGVYGSHWAWIFKGAAHRVLDRLMDQEGLAPMALAMPSDGLWGDGSGYVAHAAADYAKWITEEVPAAASLVDARCATPRQFICGLSMGGYGALRLGALHAEQYAGVSAHSSITDVAQMQGFVEETSRDFDLAEESPLPVLECMKAKAQQLPPVRFDCGTEDRLLGHNQKLHHDLVQAGISHTYQEFPGDHTWDYWREHLADSLRFFGRLLG